MIVKICKALRFAAYLYYFTVKQYSSLVNLKPYALQNTFLVRLIFFSFYIGSMQKFVCLMAVRRAEVFFVKESDRGVFVRGAYFAVCIVIVKSLSTDGFQIDIVSYFVVNVGLTATVYKAIISMKV